MSSLVTHLTPAPSHHPASQRPKGGGTEGKGRTASCLHSACFLLPIPETGPWRRSVHPGSGDSELHVQIQLALQRHQHQLVTVTSLDIQDPAPWSPCVERGDARPQHRVSPPRMPEFRCLCHLRQTSTLISAVSCGWWQLPKVLSSQIPYIFPFQFLNTLLVILLYQISLFK